MARRKDTSESWINTIIFIMNLQKLLKIAGKYGYFLYSFSKSINQILDLVFYRIYNLRFNYNLNWAC